MKKLIAAVNLSATLLLTISTAAHSLEGVIVAENGGERVIQQQKKRHSDHKDSIKVAEDGSDRVLGTGRQKNLEKTESLQLAADGSERSRSLRRV
jgi:hypothetical protein